MYDIMKAKVITDSKTFSRVAKLKSRRYLVKQSWLPLLIALFFTGVILVYGWATGDYGMHYFVQGWYDISFTIEWEMTTVFGFLKLLQILGILENYLIFPGILENILPFVQL